MSYQQRQESDRHRPGPSSIGAVTLPDFALVATFQRPAPGVPGGMALPGLICDDTLIGLQTYVALCPPPERGPGGELIRMSIEQLRRLKSTLSYLVSRADALVITGRDHLVDEAERAWLRGDEVSPRSYVGVTVRTGVQYLAPAIGEEAALNRPPKRRNGTGPREVIVPDGGGG